jgi:hypothetical protein
MQQRGGSDACSISVNVSGSVYACVDHTHQAALVTAATA